MKDNLSLVFSALSDPTRRAILARLSLGEANVSDLAEPFLKKMSLPAITKHLKVLESAGLIDRSQEAQWRPCKLNPKKLQEVDDWIQTYRAFWNESLDRLELYLDSIAGAEDSILNSKGVKSGKKIRKRKGKRT